MFSTKIRGSKAFAAEQKNREFKKILLKVKTIEKRFGKRIKPNELIRKATDNLHRTQSAKYGFSPDQVEENSLENDNFTDLYDVRRLVRLKEAKERIEMSETNKNDQKRRKLIDPLDIGEKVLVLAERLKKKMCQKIFSKLRPKRNSFLIDIGFLLQIKEFYFQDTYNYWLKENNKQIHGCF